MREKKRLEAWLNGRSLRAVSGIVLVQQITEEGPQAEATYADNPAGHGQRLLSLQRKNRRVTVTVQLRELYDLARRAETLDALNAWAGEGWLEVSYRPFRRLRVACVSRPAMGAAREVTASYDFAFEAAACPFWEDTARNTLALTGASASGTLIVPGTEPSRLTARITPTGGTLTALSISAGDCAFAFSGINVPADTPVVIDYPDPMTLSVMAGNASLLPYRAAASSDDLVLAPGQRAVAFTADTACRAEFYARGLWR